MGEVFAPKAAKRIAHVRAHLDVGFPPDLMAKCIANIENQTGSPSGSAMNLAMHAEASAISAWFERRDLAAMRQWFYVAARLDRLVRESEPPETRGPGGKVFPLHKPLLANNKALLDWFVARDCDFDQARVANHKTYDFWAYQAIVAIRGDWGRLRERCEQVLADPPGAGGLQKYLRDHYFYLALARDDRDGMEAALREIVSPAALRGRNADDSGYAADLISTAAVIYAKIAWLHGHQVSVDTPYIPAEWLPMTPLARYDPCYRFLT